MNRLFINLSAGILLCAAISSCAKKEYCYDCTTVRTEIMLPENIEVNNERTTMVHCNQTEESIKEVELNGTRHTTFNKDGKVYQEQMSTTCVPY